MKKTRIRVIAIIAILILGVTIQGVLAIGMVEVIGTGAIKYAQSTLYDSYLWHFQSAMLFVNGTIKRAKEDPWAAYPQLHITKTATYTLQSNDSYFAYGTHAIGPDYSFVEEEWTTSTNVAIYDPDKSSSPELAYLQTYNSLKNIGERIAKYFKLPTDNLTYYNMLDTISDSAISNFEKTLNVKVIGYFTRSLDVGDYAPSYWIDSVNCIVYIGTQLKDGSYILYKSNWNINKDVSISWSTLEKVNTNLSSDLIVQK